MTIEIYSDLICPWCYIGKRRFAQGMALSGLSTDDVRVIWKPFELNPDMPEDGMDRKEYRIKKFGSWEYSQQLDRQVKDAAATVGLEFNYERQKRTPNTRKAHLLLQLAVSLDRQDALSEALFAAYFTHGRDIGSESTLIEIAESAGLSKNEVESALKGPAQLQQVIQELAEAAHLGIRSVPSFVINGSVAFSGAQDPKIIGDVLQGLKSSATG